MCEEYTLVHSIGHNSKVFLAITKKLADDGIITFTQTAAVAASFR